MTKKLKSSLSLFLAVMMLFSIMPTTVLAVATYLTPTTTELFGSASFADGYDERVLTDDYYYVANDVGKGAVLKDDTLETPIDNLSKVAAFTDVESGIKWTWDSAVNVKRLDLWILSCGGIGNYEVQTSADDTWENPTTVASGTLDLYEGTSVAITEATKASYYPIIFPEEAVNVKYLRFIIKSFAEGETAAYISQAMVYDTNDINLGELLLYPSNEGAKKGFSPYLQNFNMSTGRNYSTNDSSKKKTYYYGEGTGTSWPYYSSGGQVDITPFSGATTTGYTNGVKKGDDAIGDMWYATGVGGGRSKVKVNRICLNIGAGTIKGFKVYSANSAGFNSTNYPSVAPLDYSDSWQEVANVICNISKTTTATERTFEIPQAILSSYFYIEITDYDTAPTPSIKSIDMYSVADYELDQTNAGIAAEKIFATELSTDTADNSKAKEIIGGIKSSYTFNGVTYNVKWSCTDKDGNATDIIDLATGEISFHEDEKEIILIAEVSKAGESTAYVVSKKFTLLPRENTYKVKIGGEEKSQLNDGFLFSAYDKGNVTIEDDEKFALITENNTAIEFEWFVANPTKRLDLWAYPQGAIKEYKVEADVEGNWVEISSGNLETTEESSFAAYYPIIFEGENIEKANSAKLRLTLLSLNEDVYISEAVPAASSEIDFAAAPKGAEGIAKAYSHHMGSFAASAVDGENAAESSAVWPVDSEGNDLSITANSGELWYSAGFTGAVQNINEVTVNIAEGTASTIELLSSDDNDSWSSVAKVRGNFTSSSPAVIELAEEVKAKYWKVDVKKHTDAKLGRINFSITDGSTFLPAQAAADEIAASLSVTYPDTESGKINIPASPYTYEGNVYNVTYEFSSEKSLTTVNADGTFTKPESNDYVTVTVKVSYDENTISYCAEKKLRIKGNTVVDTVELFGDETVDGNTDILSDGEYYTTYEMGSIAKTAYNNAVTAAGLSEASAAEKQAVGIPAAKAATSGEAHSDKVIKLTQENSGIIYTINEGYAVKRLDIWMLNEGGIKEYVVEVSDNKEDWTPLKAGSFSIYQGSMTTYDFGGFRASYYPIIFDTDTTSSYLRFRVVSFMEEDNKVSYIAEALPRTTNEINLGAHNVFPEQSSKSGKTLSPYLWGYIISDNDKDKRESGYMTSTDTGKMWPSYNSDSLIAIDENNSDAAQAEEKIWYGTSFYRSNVKVNRIGLNILSGEVNEFKVYAIAEGGKTINWSGNPAKPTTGEGSGWTEVAAVKCNMTADSDAGNGVLFDLPNAIEANGYLIHITDCTDDAAISSMDMYALAEGEIDKKHPALAAEEAFASKLSTDTGKPYEAKEWIHGISDGSLIFDGKFDGTEYNVVWSCTDKEGNATDIIDLATGNIGFHEEDTEIILTATVSKAGESIKYSVSKKFTLLALKNEVTVKIGDNDASSLTDGFLFSSYDKGEVTPEANPEKFMKITEANTAVIYRWIGKEKINRINVWAVGALGEYAVEKSDDGTVWSPVKEGSFGSVSTESAAYYPIVLDNEVETKYLRLIIKSLNGEVYIAEAKPSKEKTINFNAAPEGAEGAELGYSHYMQSYVVSNTSDENKAYRRNSSTVWPMYADGTSPSVTPDGGQIWYATGFSIPEVKLNRVIVPIVSGSATEVQVLCATGSESGFELNSETPKAPDTVSDWKVLATLRGSFNSSNSAVIDINNAPLSKYWMVRVKGAKDGTAMGRPEFYEAKESEISPLVKIASELMDTLTTDTEDVTIAKTKINLFPTYNFDGKDYTVTWESSSKLVNTTTGDIDEHEKDDKTTLTALISDPDNAGISYVVSKDILLRGMLTVSVFTSVGKEKDSGVLLDDFTYVDYYLGDKVEILKEPKNAYYNPDKFVHFTEINSGIEFYWEKPKSIKRLELWSWPIDAISSYEIQVSNDGETWTKHYEGTVEDRYKDDPSSRPADESDDADSAYFFPVIFDAPTEEVQYIRFVIKGFRDDAQGAYIAEAYFRDSNDVNYIGFGSIAGTETHNSYKAHSKYTSGFYLCTTDPGSDKSTRRNTPAIWPVYSSSGVSPAIIPDENGCIWYATSFQGYSVPINKVYFTVGTGEAFEVEIKCAESASGFQWSDFPVCPDTLAEYKTVAKVSGKFGKGTHEIQFDNDFKSRYWMIKITDGTSDLQVTGAGLYTLGKYELSPSCFVLDGVFDNVADTEIDGVIKSEINIPTSVEIGGKPYDIIWNYDTEIIDEEGNVIPALEDREIVIKARIGSPEESYKHVLEKTYYVLGQDDRARTELLKKENITLDGPVKESFSAALDYGLTYDGRKELLLDFSEGSQEGRVILHSGEEELLNLHIIEGMIIANEGTEKEASMPFAEKVKLALEGKNYSISSYNGSIYTVKLYNKELLTSGSPDSIILYGSEGGALKLDSMKLKVVSENLFEAIKEQFVFSRLSPSYRAANLNANLNLIDKIADVSFTYESGNESIIKIDNETKTGVVNLSAPGETYVKVTASNSSIAAGFEKTFSVLTGRENVFGEAKSASPAAAVEGKLASFAVDGDLESEFVTTARAYRINLDLKKTQAFNKLRIIEADTEAKITGYEIWVSGNNVDFTKVYTGTTINSGELVTIPYSEAGFARFVVTETSGSGSGIREICAYNDMSDKDKLDYDYSVATKDLEIKDGTTLPQKGRFGTEFELISDNSAVKISETTDKENNKLWKVTVAGAKKETVVTVTLKASNGEAKAEPKEFKITVFADTNIRDNEISGGGSAGSGGSGGGGGSVSGGSSGSVAITPNVSQSTGIDSELKNHWGSNEIKTLVSKGIVQGDGTTLALSRSVTRAEFCKMIITALKLELVPHRGTFYDVSKNDWFTSFAETAFEYGIMSGDVSGFRGNDVISRQEMAVVLINALKSQLPDVKTEKELSFTDGESIASWANDAVKLAAGLELLNGYDTGDFKPEKELRRDEAMVVVYRVLSHIGK